MNLQPGSTSRLTLFLNILSLALFRAFSHSLAEHGGELGDAVSGEARVAAQLAFGAELDRRGLRILQDLVRVSDGTLSSGSSFFEGDVISYSDVDELHFYRVVRNGWTGIGDVGES